MMTRELPYLRLCAFLLYLPWSCQAGGESPPVSAATDDGRPEVNWISLRYAANRLGVSLSTTLELAQSSRREMLAPPYAAFRDEPFQTESGGVPAVWRSASGPCTTPASADSAPASAA
jgi:hypothetical protein